MLPRVVDPRRCPAPPHGRHLAPLSASLLSLLLAAWPYGAVQAVPDGKVSMTALFVCEYRAIAAQHPDPALRNPDDLATRMCPPTLLPREYEPARDLIDMDPVRYAGYFYVNARTRHIDELLQRAAGDGITQVVQMGAGFDSRAYRFHARFPVLRFFEVDLPATIEAKQQVVRRLFGDLPAQVRYVPLDFDRQSLDPVLSDAGYDPAQRTLFILEGVSMYVDGPGNEATFDFMARRSAPGSLVVFDYVLRRVIDGDFTGLYAAARDARGVASIGEPYLTGWTPAQAARFVGRHGMTVLEDLDAAELTRRYLTGRDGKADGRLPDGFRVIDARVR